MECSLPGSSVYGIAQARILEWLAIFFSRGFSWPRDWSHISCIGRRILYHWATLEADIKNTLFWQSSRIWRPPLGLLVHWKELAEVMKICTDGFLQQGCRLNQPWAETHEMGTDQEGSHVKVPFVLSQWSPDSTGFFGDDVWQCTGGNATQVSSLEP